MATGISLHIGVNNTDPVFGMSGLRGCVHDAEAMREIAIAHDFDARPVLPDEKANLASVKGEIVDAAGKLHEGDIFLFTFAGHGSKSNASPSHGEDDGRDETILLSDCIVIDDYIRRVLWSKFDEGVRILAIADCCHGGSALFAFLGPVIKPVTAFFGSAATMLTTAFTAGPIRSATMIREFTRDDEIRINKTPLGQGNAATIRAELAAEGKEPKATLLTLSGCNDFEDAQDGDDHGAFTKAMLEVLCDQAPPPNIDELVPRIRANLNLVPNYDELMKRIGDNFVAKEIKKQHPTRYPKINPDAGFLGQAPFTI